MDIRDKLLETVDASDPQFKVLLNNAIKQELASLEAELAAKRAFNEKLSYELKFNLERRQIMKKSIQEKLKLSAAMDKAKKSLQDYAAFLLEALVLARSSLDDDGLNQSAYLDKEEKLLEEMEKKYEEYKAEFEKDPLAQKRKAARQRLLKTEVEIKMSIANIQDLKSNNKLFEEITAKIEQQKIIKLAKAWLAFRDHVEENKLLKQELDEWKFKIKQQEQELQLYKEKAGEDKSNTMARILMPPPIMDKEMVNTILHPSTERNIPETLIDDNASMCSSIFEEMCEIREKGTPRDVGTVQRATEPDQISITSSHDVQSIRDNISEASLQSCETASRHSEDFNRKKRHEHHQNRSGNISGTHIGSKKSKMQEQFSSKEDTEKKAKLNSQKQRKQYNTPKSRENSRSRESSVCREISHRREMPERKEFPEKRKSQDRKTGQERVPEKKETSKIIDISEDSVSRENIPMDTDLNSDNRSFCGSVNSFTYQNSPNNDQGSNAGLNSDLSFQSPVLDDENNSIVFTADELSNTDNNTAVTEESVQPSTAAPTPFGFFGMQNSGALNFKGLFFK